MSIKEKYKKYSRDEHAKEIVIGIAKIGFTLSLAVFAPNAAGHIIKMLGWVPDYKSKTRTERTLKSLRRRRLIAYQTTGGKTRIYLTGAGKQYYQKISMEAMQLPISKNWDKRWRMVTFDIPEKQKINRRHFSKTLSILGMYNLEKSIFVYPFDCRKEIMKVADSLRVCKYTRYVIADYVQNDLPAKKFFKLLY